MDDFNTRNIQSIAKDLKYSNVKKLGDIFEKNNIGLGSNFIRIGELKPESAEIFKFPVQSENIKKIPAPKKPIEKPIEKPVEANPAARAEFAKLLAKIKA